ncbi:MAG: tetratricopeptide repeat protein [Gammaproteobacteria bacterium]|nr:tetratricopeptide repeat protein [Gammaproteobacteria bacterium]
MSPLPEAARAALQAAFDHHQAGRLAEAEALYRQVLQHAPGQPDALHYLGVLAQQCGHHAAAVELIKQALRVIPGHAHCHLHLGLALQSLGRLDEALASYRHAQGLDPRLPEAHNNEGNLLLDQGDAAAAVPCFERALALNPDFVVALNNRGMALVALGRPEAALAALDRALALQSNHPEALLNRGNALQALNRFEEAIAAYSRSLEGRPDNPDAHNNLGHALDASGRPAEAIASFQRAQALRPEFAAALWNEGVARLRQGDFAAGWRLFEWRHRALGARRLVREYQQPLWLGAEPLAGRTLLIHHEQGLGDTLQMLRYVPELAARGARVVIEVPTALEALARSVPGDPLVVAEGSPLPSFELQCPMMSLPLACGTTLETIPATVPYLAATAESRDTWAKRLGSATGRRIGLAWSGSPGHQNDRQRSIPLSLFTPLLELPGEFQSLQREYRDADRALLPGLSLRDWSSQLATLADTAGLASQLDLVITVDTAVAHLAGALGKPVWLLLPSSADYRWLTGRSDSPWYPTMRLFRQPSPGDWPAVLRAVAAALAAGN